MNEVLEMSIQSLLFQFPTFGSTQKLFCLNSWAWQYWQRLLDVFNDIFNITPTITLHFPNSHPPSFPLFRLDIDICWCIYKIFCIQSVPPLRAQTITKNKLQHWVMGAPAHRETNKTICVCSAQSCFWFLNIGLDCCHLFLSFVQIVKVGGENNMTSGRQMTGQPGGGHQRRMDPSSDTNRLLETFSVFKTPMLTTF